jgi:hypothetical protein
MAAGERRDADADAHLLPMLRMMSARDLEVFRAALILDREHGADPAFCHGRLDAITLVLAERSADEEAVRHANDDTAWEPPIVVPPMPRGQVLRFNIDDVDLHRVIVSAAEQLGLSVTHYGASHFDVRAPEPALMLAFGEWTGRVLREQTPPALPSITCPRCGRTSYNPNDIRERYCGACHHFHEQL